VVAGAVAGFGTGANDAASGIEHPVVGSATIAITNLPASTACLRVTAAGSGTDTRMLPIPPGRNTDLDIRDLPAGRDRLYIETFSVPCAAVTDDSTPNGHSEPTLVMISVGDTARVAMTVIRDVEPHVEARLSPRLKPAFPR
jgi:hypothetical protein